MKKLLLIPAILAGTLALAEQKKYEISPMVGYNLHESSLGFKDDGYLLGGLEVQINNVASKIKPEFSLFGTNGVNYTNGQDTQVIRAAFNGVYNLGDYQTDIFTPFVKAGLGVESLYNETTQNRSGLFLDAGVGAKVAFTDNLALKLEAIYLAKMADHNTGLFDHNLMTLVGFTYSFGDFAQKEAPEPTPAPVVEEVVEAVVIVPVIVDGDDDNDGVLNSQDKCKNTLAGVKVDATGCNIDNDNDGVLNDKDICPNTLAGVNVDATGCNIDNDNDGVLNDKDICPNTLAGDTVNSDGCPKTVLLHVNFGNNSAKITNTTESTLQKYADFLIAHTNYNAKIVGYTDSRGSSTYNQKLSQKRADSVMNDLISRGVAAKQLSALGKGESNPIADNATAEGRAQNRRIEAQLLRD